jgi:hypothetical protein
LLSYTLLSCRAYGAGSSTSGFVCVGLGSMQKAWVWCGGVVGAGGLPVSSFK